MELILKLPYKKPPFLGILFESPGQPSYGFKAAWFRDTNADYELILEPSRDLMIWLVKGDERIRYAVSYDAVKLLKFVVRTKDAPVFVFGCLYLSNGNYKIAKTLENPTNMVLQVKKLILLTDELSTGGTKHVHA